MDFLPASPCAQRIEVDGHRAEHETLDATSAASHHCLNPCQQLVEIERLGEIVVGAQFQSAQLVGFLGASREDHYWSAPSLTHQATQFEAAAVREHEIEEDEVWLKGAKTCDRLAAVPCGTHLIARESEIVGNDLRQHVVVFDDQDASLHTVCLVDRLNWKSTAHNELRPRFSGRYRSGR